MVWGVREADAVGGDPRPEPMSPQQSARYWLMPITAFDAASPPGVANHAWK